MKPKTAKLFCQTGALAGTKIDISRDILIGRKPTCDLVLYPHTISGRHARIYFDDAKDAYYIEDLESSNGTRVDRVLVDKPVRLDTLNVITLANDVDFIFQIVDSAKPSTPKKTAVPKPSQKTAPSKVSRQRTEYQQAFSPTPDFTGSSTEQAPSVPERKNTVYQSSFSPPPDLEANKSSDQGRTVYNKSFDDPPPRIQPPPAKPEAEPEKLTLVVTTKDNEERFRIRPGVNSIGRSSSCDITISDPFISSSHASLQLTKNSIIIEDLGSSNKTYINGKAITKPVQLKPGMEIRFGPNSNAKIIKD